ncbi:MAG: ATP-dependent DNA helicase UvrD2 [Thermoleophilia bacterium]|nr:ATP-dependent DNA helicase UvrD2 [Thermoleophilia bacterium]
MSTLSPTAPVTESTPASADLLARLNPAQRVAAEAVRGPVAILAGAGTGKTTTVTHRIAWQVASGTFAARELLAVTFTDKAAGELRERLTRLGVRGVEARTFHGAARWMLSIMWPHYRGTPMPELPPQKGLLLDQIARSLPAPDCFRPRRELAQEIEWAKNRRVAPKDYLAELDRTGHEQPLRDAGRMLMVYEAYEAAKRSVNAWDFEDLLWQLADLLDEFPEAAERLRKRFRAVTVDEYQDVNPLQQALLDHWTSATNDICVVGDDYQTIFAFTGASPAWLLEFPQRHPDATVVRLEESFRSTPQVLELANRLTPKLGGFEKTLRTADALLAQPDFTGPAPYVESYATRADEAAYVAREAKRLHLEEGVDYHEMAILYRINARSPEFESALAAAGVPFVVRSGAFLDRPGARGLLRMLDNDRRPGGDVRIAAQSAAERLGWREDGQVKGSDEAQTLQEDLSRLVGLAGSEAWSDPATFAMAMRMRFAVNADTSGVELLTMHRAKGLEWDAVFLPRLNAKELPFKSRTSAADTDDERRLLYVGITRARRHLYLTRAADAGAPSEFLVELGVVSPQQVRTEARSSGSGRTRGSGVELDDSDPLVASLREWRRIESTKSGKPAYTVFDDKTIAAIVAAKPRSEGALLEVKGVGPAKVERYGETVIDLVRAALAEN